MKNLKYRKISQTFLSITLCAVLLWGLLGNKTVALAAEGFVMPETPYIINLEEATKVGDTYWFQPSQVVTIKAPDTYQIRPDENSSWNQNIEISDRGEDGFPYPTVLLIDANGVQSDPIPITEQIAWDSYIPTGVIGSQAGLQWDSLQEQLSFATAVEKGSSAATFSISANDMGSGIASIEYYIAGWNLIEDPLIPASEQIEAVAGNGWISYTNGQTISLTQHGENVIYVKIMDYVGNTKYISSGGIVLYEQPSVNVSDIAYTKGEGNTPFFQVTLNGNQYGGDLLLKDESGNTVVGFTPKEGEDDTDWGYSSGDGSITLNNVFLDNLAVDGKDAKYILTIHYLALEDIYLDLQNSNADAMVGPSTINLTIKNPALDFSHWGESVLREDGKLQFIDNTGKTSIEISSANTDNGKIWISEQVDGMKTWFGLDMLGDALANDQHARFYAHFLSESDNGYAQLYNQLDENVRADIESDRVWIFNVGVETFDGIEVQPNGSVKLFVQIDDSWDAEDIRAYNITTGQDEAISVTIDKNVQCAVGTADFAVLELRHFSPYMIFDQGTTDTVPPTDGDEDGLIEEPTDDGEGESTEDPTDDGEGESVEDQTDGDEGGANVDPAPGDDAESSGNSSSDYYHFEGVLLPKTGEVNYWPMMMVFSAVIFVSISVIMKINK